MSNAYETGARELRDGRIAPVYLLIGDETWSKERFLELLKKTLVDPSMADFNFEQFHANELTGVDAVDKAGMLPMMSDRRLLIVENCDAWKKKDLDVVTKYLGAPCDTTTLVMSFTKADRRKKFFSAKQSGVRLLDFPRPRQWELPEFIRGVATGMRLRLTPDAVELVAELAGDDISKVHRELDKLSIFKLGSNQIEAEDVEALMGRTRMVTRWELNEMLGKRDLPQALIKAHDIIDSGSDAISLLSAINMFLRQLFLVKIAMTKGVRDKGKMAQLIGVPPKIAGDLMGRQRAYSSCELRRAFDLMRQADSKLKGSGIDRRLIVDHLLCEIMMRSELSPPASGR
ncbi:DNA polymerase III subunit delta [Sulfidibacter corallicola]|uniref:DNA polymerase III subunit delta n=1 Tax=Sulfidibacter corallicola TaxID=2818388 RepID=A0A8A4TFU6_SULCO|nr:DNA polymerase III subunit delta [Sulfidibacter corallicola]QTD47578.1 DNA polymerase III subunit delta [Sulfidibacter corallicola]